MKKIGLLVIVLLVMPFVFGGLMDVGFDFIKETIYLVGFNNACTGYGKNSNCDPCLSCIDGKCANYEDGRLRPGKNDIKGFDIRCPIGSSYCVDGKCMSLGCPPDKPYYDFYYQEDISGPADYNPPILNFVDPACKCAPPSLTGSYYVCDDGNENTVDDKCNKEGICEGTSFSDKKCEGKNIGEYIDGCICDGEGKCDKDGCVQYGGTFIYIDEKGNRAFKQKFECYSSYVLATDSYENRYRLYATCNNVLNDRPLLHSDYGSEHNQQCKSSQICDNAIGCTYQYVCGTYPNRPGEAVAGCTPCSNSGDCPSCSFCSETKDSKGNLIKSCQHRDNDLRCLGGNGAMCSAGECTEGCVGGYHVVINEDSNHMVEPCSSKSTTLLAEREINIPTPRFVDYITERLMRLFNFNQPITSPPEDQDPFSIS